MELESLLPMEAAFTWLGWEGTREIKMSLRHILFHADPTIKGEGYPESKPAVHEHEARFVMESRGQKKGDRFHLWHAINLTHFFTSCDVKPHRVKRISSTGSCCQKIIFPLSLIHSSQQSYLTSSIEWANMQGAAASAFAPASHYILPFSRPGKCNVIAADPDRDLWPSVWLTNEWTAALPCQARKSLITLNFCCRGYLYNVIHKARISRKSNPSHITLWIFRLPVGYLGPFSPPLGLCHDYYKWTNKTNFLNQNDGLWK